MKTNAASDFLYQLIALLVAIIVVHAVYVTVVRPQAAAVLAEQRALEADGRGYDMGQSLYVILKDYEQETCFILMLWASAIVGYKGRYVLRERRHLSRDLLAHDAATRILPEDVRKFARPLQALPSDEREFLLPRALLAALQRFGSTQSIHDVAQSVREVCETEAARLESELAMIRYIAWAIPSIGFIGTVRGIGMALSQAHRAVEGDIVGVTVSLGVAFNSTFVALVLSLVLMFLLHQVQLLQERFVLDAQQYCDVHLVRHLAVR